MGKASLPRLALRGDPKERRVLRGFRPQISREVFFPGRRGLFPCVGAGGGGWRAAMFHVEFLGGALRRCPRVSHWMGEAGPSRALLLEGNGFPARFFYGARDLTLSLSLRREEKCWKCRLEVVAVAGSGFSQRRLNLVPGQSGIPDFRIGRIAPAGVSPSVAALRLLTGVLAQSAAFPDEPASF